MALEAGSKARITENLLSHGRVSTPALTHTELPTQGEEARDTLARTAGAIYLSPESILPDSPGMFPSSTPVTAPPVNVAMEPARGLVLRKPLIPSDAKLQDLLGTVIDAPFGSRDLQEIWLRDGEKRENVLDALKCRPADRFPMEERDYDVDLCYLGRVDQNELEKVHIARFPMTFNVERPSPFGRGRRSHGFGNN